MKTIAQQTVYDVLSGILERAEGGAFEDPDAAIRRFCELQAAVSHARGDHSYANDCFCGEGGPLASKSLGVKHYRNDLTSLRWIVEAVEARFRAEEGET